MTTNMPRAPLHVPRPADDKQPTWRLLRSALEAGAPTSPPSTTVFAGMWRSDYAEEEGLWVDRPKPILKVPQAIPPAGMSLLIRPMGGC